MNRNQRRSRLAVTVFGSCLVAAMAVAPASAALTSGSFFVHAQNTDDPSIEAVAGRGGLDSDSGTPGSGDPGSNPGDGDGSQGGSSAEMVAGPLTLKVTPAMLAFSDANRKAQEEGRTGDIKTDPDGWQTIWNISLSDYSTHPGVPADMSSAVIILSKLSTAPDLDVVNGVQSDADTPVRALYIKYDSVIQAYDFRAPAKVGDNFSYADTGNQVAEGRYTMTEGKLIATYVIRQPDGSFQVQRGLTASTVGNGLSSTTTPWNATFNTEGKPTNLSLRFPDKSRGYSRVDLDDRPDLNGYVIQYRDRDSAGPQLLIIDSDTGKPKSADYLDADGATRTIEISSAADYNAQTGQNWDGKFEKFSDFDLTIPFKP